MAPAVVMVPANPVLVPAAVLVTSPNAGTSPTVGAEVGTVSPCV